ncbi:MAG: Smr/MutS family protein [Alphaproteobacteria bacterium]|nr:Smr/MutS family protein [Alphaproteobacteria bacterium]
MRQLNDKDIAEMIDDDVVIDNAAVRSSVRHELQLSKKIPVAKTVPEHITIDLHQHTEQEAWDIIMGVAQSGARRATIITGASGILKIKFQQWARDSLLSPYIVSFTPINNGSFSVKFKK